MRGRADYHTVSACRPVSEPHAGYQGDGSVWHRIFCDHTGTAGLDAELCGAAAPGTGAEDLQALHKADGGADQRYPGAAA